MKKLIAALIGALALPLLAAAPAHAYTPGQIYASDYADIGYTVTTETKALLKFQKDRLKSDRAIAAMDKLPPFTYYRNGRKKAAIGSEILDLAPSSADVTMGFISVYKNHKRISMDYVAELGPGRYNAVMRVSYLQNGAVYNRRIIHHIVVR